jgi:nitrate reductase NapAB chaperone NapD
MRRSILVSIDDQYLPEMSQMVHRLEQAGLEVEQTLGELGVVSGTAEAENISALRDLDGVASVDAEREVVLPPPDAPIQ